MAWSPRRPTSLSTPGDERTGGMSTPGDEPHTDWALQNRKEGRDEI
jgi:hypothetical protein